MKSLHSIDPNRWIQEHGDSLHQFAMIRVKNSDVAEELVQETFLSALRSLENFQGNASERTWLISILKHKLIDHLRQARRESLVSQIEGEDHWVNSLFDERERWKSAPKHWESRPESALEQEEFWQVIHVCLSKVPDRLARAFHLKVVDEESSEIVCKALHISPTNLWVMLHRARMRLWYCLSENWFGDAE